MALIAIHTVDRDVPVSEVPAYALSKVLSIVRRAKETDSITVYPDGDVMVCYVTKGLRAATTVLSCDGVLAKARTHYFR